MIRTVPDTATSFQVLELPETAGAAEIRRAYRRLVLLTHPDRNPDGQTSVRFLRIVDAYQSLKRMGYLDASRQARQPVGSPPPPVRVLLRTRPKRDFAGLIAVAVLVTAISVSFLSYPGVFRDLLKKGEFGVLSPASDSWWNPDPEPISVTSLESYSQARAQAVGAAVGLGIAAAVPVLCTGLALQWLYNARRRRRSHASPAL